jgi:hypothetical protein
MKSPSQSQSPTTTPTTLINSINLQALSNSDGGDDSPMLPINMTNDTSSESKAVQRRRRLRMILTSAIALLDGDDFVPMESSTAMYQQQRQLSQ